MKEILVYGSLKQGYWNHERFNLDANYRWKGVVYGFKLMDLGPYPGAVYGTSTDGIICERYEVDDETFRFLDLMERGAGYLPEPVDGATLWVYQHPDENDAPCPKNAHGFYEWVGGPRIL